MVQEATGVSAGANIFHCEKAVNICLDCCARPLLSSADWQRCRSSLCNAEFYIKWTSASTARLPWSYCCFLVLLAGERLAVQFCTGPPKIQFLPTQLLQATFKFHRRGQKQGGVGLAAAKGTGVEAAASVVSSQSGRHFHIKMTKTLAPKAFREGCGRSGFLLTPLTMARGVELNTVLHFVEAQLAWPFHQGSLEPYPPGPTGNKKWLFHPCYERTESSITFYILPALNKYKARAVDHTDAWQESNRFQERPNWHARLAVGQLACKVKKLKCFEQGGFRPTCRDNRRKRADRSPACTRTPSGSNWECRRSSRWRDRTWLPTRRPAGGKTCKRKRGWVCPCARPTEAAPGICRGTVPPQMVEEQRDI